MTNTFSESCNMLSMSLLLLLRLKGNCWQNYHFARVMGSPVQRQMLYKLSGLACASCYWPPGKYNPRRMWPPHSKHLFIECCLAFVFLMHQVTHGWYIFRATLVEFSTRRASSFIFKTLHVDIFRGLWHTICSIQRSGFTHTSDKCLF